MRFPWRIRVAACLAIFLAALCLFARPTADCLSPKAAFCAVERLVAETADALAPVSALPVAMAVTGAVSIGAYFFFRPNLRVRMPVSVHVPRVPWRDRHVPYAAAMRDQ